MLDILFKQLGFNPADLKKQVDDAGANFTKVINHFNSRIDIIELQNKKIIALLEGGVNDADSHLLETELQKQHILNGENDHA